MLQQDCLRRFLFEDMGVRGQWVNLATSWQTAKKLQTSPLAAQLQLGQALSAVVLLSSTIKYQGSLILQTECSGPLTTLVAQATHDRKIRGLVRCSSDLAVAAQSGLFGEGRLVMTVSSDKGSPYQGIVPVTGDKLGNVIETYFSQSEQLPTRLWLAADSSRTAGLMLQQLPSYRAGEDWERLEMLAGTITEHELLNLSCEKLLYRLFNEEKVRVYDPEPVQFGCSCSLEKIENTLRLLGRQELESILSERELIEVNCEFCNKNYRFDKVDVENLLLWGQKMPQRSQTKH